MVPIGWKEFKSAFLNRFFPLELMETKIQEFINLHQGSISVREYAFRFTKLFRYVPFMVVDLTTRMSKFISGISSLVSKKSK